MNIVELELSELMPYENNPRINDGAVEKVAESIKQFGFKVPLVVDKSNVIVCGHTRYKACKLLGINLVPCVVADDLSEKQIKAFRLADNKTAEMSGWEFSKLDEELAFLDDFEMSLFGFEEEIQEMNDEMLSSFFDSSKNEDNQKRVVVCPHCGERIEL